jgi:hypothetical protein
MINFEQPTEIWIITILYFVLSSITTLDIRLIQARKAGLLGPEDDHLPKWVAALYWIEWGLFIYLAFIDWKFAALVFGLKFILKVLPVLEIIGNILMRPFKNRSR